MQEPDIGSLFACNLPPVLLGSSAATAKQVRLLERIARSRRYYTYVVVEKSASSNVLVVGMLREISQREVEYP